MQQRYQPSSPIVQIKVVHIDIYCLNTLSTHTGMSLVLLRLFLLLGSAFFLLSVFFSCLTTAALLSEKCHYISLSLPPTSFSTLIITLSIRQSSNNLLGVQYKMQQKVSLSISTPELLVSAVRLKKTVLFSHGIVSVHQALAKS